MLIEILIATTIGIACGVFTGLVPGIHVNLITALMLASSALLLTFTSPLTLAAFIVSLATTHSFIDFIPSTFLGVPDSGTELAILPAHKLVMEGLGKTAVFCSLIGSFFSLIFAVALVPLLLWIIPLGYPVIENYIGWILLFLVVFIIWRDSKPFLSIMFFVSAGLLGMYTLRMPRLDSPLFPLLSGMFGVGILITSLYSESFFPKQKNICEPIPTREATPSVIAATIAGTFTSIFPGLGAAQGAALTQVAFKCKRDHGYLVLVGGINTVNFVISLVTLLTISKARNGAVVAISTLFEIEPRTMWILVGCCLIAGAASIPIGLLLTNWFCKFIPMVDYKKLVLGVISLIILLTIILSSWQGIIVLAASTALGILASSYEVPKHHLMGCLILPVLGFFLI